MNVLTRAQRSFLSRFFAQKAAQSFYLTGGGALAEFYLQHRVSQDIDLFTQDAVAWRLIERDLREAADEVGAALEFSPAAGENELHRAFLQLPGEPRLKIDVVRDSPPFFGEPILQPDGVIVDSLDNIAVGKLLALYGRAYPRDFVDVYFLCLTGLDIDRLLGLGRQKDPGLIDVYLAEMVRQVTQLDREDLPPLLKPLDLEQMKRFFLDLATRLARHSQT